jgi:lipopolysaccharide assembly outer membrane protein LptD (OstA)
MMRRLKPGCLLLLIIISFGFCSVSAQDTLRKPAADTVSIIDLLHSDRFRGRKADSVTELTMLAGNVRLKQDITLFYCDSAVINKHNNILEAFGNVRINDRDSVQVYSQYLIYHIDKKLAIARKKVRLTDGKGVLTTEELQYDTRDRIGNYTSGGKIVNGKTIITSKDATYYADLKDVYFKNDVKMRDPQYNLDTDSLLYNTGSQLATFITRTLIKDSGGGTVLTSEGYYDMKNKIASFGKRSVIKDGKGLTVTGDDIYTEDSTGKTIIKGNGVYIDTVQKVSVLANYMIADKKKNTFLATQHPLMIIEQDKDSIYVTADTLFSARMADLRNPNYHDIPVDTLKGTTLMPVKDSSDIRFLQGYHHVRIFSDSLQAVCDSLFYSARDSVFRLFTNPIVWANNTNQVTGDTIYLFTRNKKAERIYVFENAMTINKSGDSMYNQLRGNTINGYFRDGTIDFMRAKGSAQSVYYARDENNAIVGVNNAGADIIDMRFANKELNKVIFRNEVTGTMYPLRQLPEDKKTLRNFQWLDNLRPKTKFELFEDPARQ